ncbi:SDR family oxidoreductase [Affinibrenneria salicis]|uniref:SDR family oxidoreductase n=1 Tax=Affinibrenneria salicis TaxID=2590031 RepID=A0A5J5FY80_9GAMM|nr:SDR family oxidoreductase [Affinibrenneria salicis]
MHTAFVTGATGLLGNNLVRKLVERGVRVRALARSPEKARRQFADLPQVEIITGDMTHIDDFAQMLQDCDAVFHVAAYFRDNYKGGNHWDELKRINVDGTAALIAAAYGAGVRRFIQTSSIAVLAGEPGQVIDETCDRALDDADDYYRSKILADRAVRDFHAAHPDLHVCFVLPGWMWGPGDIGPTSSGQLVNDIVRGKLPGLVPGSFSVVDARDVALAQIAAAEQGRSGERYLAAGRHMTMSNLIPLLGKIAGVKTPTRQLPLPLLYGLAFIQETYARLSGKPVLLGLATVRLMVREADRTRFDPSRSERELGLRFRPVEETLSDTLTWYREHGWFKDVAGGSPA